MDKGKENIEHEKHGERKRNKKDDNAIVIYTNQLPFDNINNNNQKDTLKPDLENVPSNKNARH